MKKALFLLSTIFLVTPNEIHTELNFAYYRNVIIKKLTEFWNSSRTKKAKVVGIVVGVGALVYLGGKIPEYKEWTINEGLNRFEQEVSKLEELHKKPSKPTLMVYTQTAEEKEQSKEKNRNQININITYFDTLHSQGLLSNEQADRFQKLKGRSAKVNSVPKEN